MERGEVFLFLQESANSPEVISITPNRNKNSPKVFFVTFGVFCFYAERQKTGWLLPNKGWLLPNKGPLFLLNVSSFPTNTNL